MNSTKIRNKITFFYFYTLIILMVICGTINTIANKLQNLTSSLGVVYKHPFFVTFTIFLGDSICLIFYYLNIKNLEKTNEIKFQEIESFSNENFNYSIDSDFVKPEATPFMLIIPALCDFFGSTIMTIGITMLNGSTYQMMRGSLILFTALFSRIFLKNKLYLFHFIGLMIVISGLFLVGISNFLIKPILTKGCKNMYEEGSTYEGYLLVILAQVFVATQFIIEEKFMKQYKCHPLKAIGWEGVWGTLLYSCVLIIFQKIECFKRLNNQNNWFLAICSRNNLNQYHLEDSIFALNQIANNKLLLFYSILFSSSIAIVDYLGITVTKIASSTSRAVTDTLRTVFIWAFFLLPIVDECHREHFNNIQFLGFIFLIIGTSVYNEIIPLPFYKNSDDIGVDILDKYEVLSEDDIKNNLSYNDVKTTVGN